MIITIVEKLLNLLMVFSDGVEVGVQLKNMPSETEKMSESNLVID